MKDNTGKDNAKKILIIDGHGLAYRAFYAIKATLTAPDGTPTNAITGFVNMLTMAQDKIKPACSIAVFDAPAPTFRHELLPQYKANRKPSPDEFRQQIPILQNLLRALGCPVLSIAGVEADDVIGSLATASAQAGYQAVILSSDKDLTQLLGPNIIMLRPLKHGISEAELFNAEDFEREHGYPSSSVPDFLALTGDSSDNVPGVNGIGAKTAATLISHFRTIDAIYDELDTGSSSGVITTAVRKKLTAVEREAVLKTRELIKLKLDVPVNLDEYINFRPTGDTQEDAIALAQKLGLSRLLKRLVSQTTGSLDFGSGDTQLKLELKSDDSDSQKSNIKKSTATAQAKPQTSQDVKSRLETEIRANDPVWPDAQLVSLPEFKAALALTGNKTEIKNTAIALAFAPQSNSLDDNKFQVAFAPDYCYAECSLDEVIAFLNHHADYNFITQDYKAFLKLSVIPECAKVTWDLRTAYYLLHPDITEKAFPLLIPNNIAPAPALFALKLKFDSQVQANNLSDLNYVMTKIDLPLLPVLDRMERHGVRLDPDKFATLQSELESRISSLEREIQDINRTAGGTSEINLNSPVQIATLLFERLGLPPESETKGKRGYSTSAAVLEHLSHLPEPANQAPSLILEYRELSKMLSGFVIPLQKAAHDNNIIHTTFEAAFTGTGRLSSRDPNLQNIPAFGTWAEKIKAGLVPVHEGNVFVAADYSQIELRVLAHMSQEQKLIDAFKNGHDIHGETAAWVFAPEPVTPELRRRAKMINFGLLYGMKSFGLAERLNISRDEASGIMKRYFATLPNVKGFIDNITTHARADGFTRTLDGRIRPIHDLEVYMNVNSKPALDRVLLNAPIQGTAADIARRAMINFDKAFADDPDVELFLQVHDSLVCECPAARAEEVGIALSQIMQDAAREILTSVEIETAIKTGNSLALI